MNKPPTKLTAAATATAPLSEWPFPLTSAVNGTFTPLIVLMLSILNSKRPLRPSIPFFLAFVIVPNTSWFAGITTTSLISKFSMVFNLKVFPSLLFLELIGSINSKLIFVSLGIYACPAATDDVFTVAVVSPLFNN